jgi:hypothetical protein
LLVANDTSDAEPFKLNQRSSRFKLHRLARPTNSLHCHGIFLFS